MTREEIQNLQEGVETDALIEETFFGSVPCDKWTPQYSALGNYHTKTSGMCGHEKCYPIGSPPQYTKNIMAAWLVVEALNKRGVFIALSNNFLNAEEKDWLKGGFVCEVCTGWDKELDFLQADTAPLAICRAAFLAQSAPN